MSRVKVAIALAVLFGLGIVANHELDVWGNRWAYASPSLLARWSGAATTDAGTRLVLVLSLRRGSPPDLVPVSDQSSSGERDIGGQAVLCERAGRRVVYTLGGFVRDARGRAALLTLEDRNHTQGLSLSRLELAWDQADSLTATGTLNRVTATGTVWSSSDRDLSRPVRFRLGRAGASANPCQ